MAIPKCIAVGHDLLKDRIQKQIIALGLKDVAVKKGRLNRLSREVCIII